MSRPDVTALLAHGALLAPMLAVTDIPFRAVCRSFGAGLTHTEMASARGIVEDVSDSYRCAVFDPGERPISMQIVAAHPSLAAAAVHRMLPLRPTMFDLNCGCPNDRICEAGAGASLLDDVTLLRDIAAAMVRVSTVPVSVKVRTRGSSGGSTIEEIARAVEDSGAAMLTVHARGRFSRYSEAARLDEIARARSAVSIPVVGDGDVFSSRDAFRMIEQTGCDGVMVARGALGTPWIFRDIADGRVCDIHESAPPNEVLLPVIIGHLLHLRREFGPVLALPRIRKHVMWYVRHYAAAASLREVIFREEDTDTVIAAVERFFSEDPSRLDPGDPACRDVETAFRTRVLFWTQAAAVTA